MPISSIGCAVGVLAACFGVGITAIPASAAVITATSFEGTCDWLDPRCWDLQPATSTPVAPNNDGTNFFNVLIDGGSAAASRVNLDAVVAVDRVEIDAGDTLRLLDGARLTLQFDPTRPGSGEVRNDGTLVLGSTQVSARLEFLGQYDAHPDVEITGAGTIELSDHAENFIGFSDFYRFVRVVLGAEQTLRGAGQIAINTNRGTIEATGIHPIVLAGALHNEGTLRAIGSGGLEENLYSYIYNSGLFEIENGSRLAMSFASAYIPEVQNSGTFRVRGADASVTAGLSNTGLVEILDGATLTGSLSQSASSALFRIGPGSTFEGSARIESGRVRIEDGLIRSDSGLQFTGSRPLLEGTGRIEMSSLNPSISPYLGFEWATLATGLDGVGRLEVDGNVKFLRESIWQVDLAGIDAESHDRLVVSGTTSFAARSAYAGSRIDLAFLPGFAPNAGDQIDILSAASIVAPTQPLEDLFTAPDLVGDLYLAPEIAVVGAEQRLRLHVLEPIAATWIAGDGDYFDAASWSFTTPATALIPDNSGLEIFDVRIGGGAAEDSTVALGTEASINRLIVDAGDTLLLGTGSRLILAKPLGRSEAREVRNNGTIALSGGALTSENGLAFSGSGTVELVDGASNYIGALTDGPIDLTNGAGHRIEGAGSIRTTTSTYSTVPTRGLFSNAGTIEATGSHELFLDANVENDGVMTARGAGGLRINGNLTQRGLLRVAEGSLLDVDDFYWQFRQETGAAVTEVGPGAVLALDTALVNGGRVALDGGTIRINSYLSTGMTIGATALLEGNGTILLPYTSSYLVVDPRGMVAPGLAGVGRLEIGTGTLISNGQLLMGIGGTTPDLFDRIEVQNYASIRGTVSVSFLDGFAPVQGDAFEILHQSGPFLSWNADLEGGVLSNGLFLVPDIRRGSNDASVTLRAKREVTAVWIGPSGDYSSPNWSFSIDPASATTPINDDQNIFDVEIGESGPVDVTFGAAARVESLSLGAGSVFDVGAGASLTIGRTPDRAQSGRIENDGSIRIGSGAGAASLLTDGDLEITGQGTIELAPSSSLGTLGNLTNGLDHTIRGAGRLASLRNLGLVEATSPSSMSIGPFENDGTMWAIGAGGLSLSSGTNRGLIESDTGSSIRAGTVWNEGEIAVFGSFTGQVENSGMIDVHAGATYSGGIHQTSEDGVTRIAGSLVASRFGAFAFDHGLLELAGGSIGFSAGGLLIRPDATLEGDGAIRAQTAFGQGVRIEGELAPGQRGVGAIEIVGAFSLAPTGSISIELSGAGAAEHDLITVLGNSVLDGTVLVKLLETGPGHQALFSPALGDMFDILIAQTIDDAEILFDLPALHTGLDWHAGVVAVDGMERLRLIVIPEPGSAALLLLGLSLLARSSARI